jgi:hypothetical protein
MVAVVLALGIVIKKTVLISREKRTTNLSLLGIFVRKSVLISREKRTTYEIGGRVCLENSH